MPNSWRSAAIVAAGLLVAGPPIVRAEPVEPAAWDDDAYRGGYGRQRPAGPGPCCGAWPRRAGPWWPPPAEAYAWRRPRARLDQPYWPSRPDWRGPPQAPHAGSWGWRPEGYGRWRERRGPPAYAFRPYWDRPWPAWGRDPWRELRW